MPTTKPKRHATIEAALSDHGDALYELVTEIELRALTSGGGDDALLAARVGAASAILNDHKPCLNQQLDIATMNGIAAAVSDGETNDTQEEALWHLGRWASRNVSDARGL
jgi:hypothetical protein